MAERDFRFAAVVRSGTVATRLAAAAALAIGVTSGLNSWAVLLFGFSAASALLAIALTRQRFGGRWSIELPDSADLKEGLPLAAKFSTASILDAADRPMLVANGFAADAGLYAIGYRIASLGQMPVMAIVRATTPDFFTRGGAGMTESFQLAKRLVGPALLVGSACAVAIWFSAPVVPTILGDEFEQVTSIIRWLAVVPLLKALQHFPANALTGGDAPMTQVAILASAAMVNVGLNAVLIPRYSFEGAIAATLIAESLYAAALWAAVGAKARRSPQFKADS